MPLAMNPAMNRVPYNVLFLCTANSARSILAEAILNKLAGGRFRAFSAGSQPRGEVHPMAIKLLQTQGIDSSFARSKAWDEFTGENEPQMDFIFTVCDSAAGEACPIWPGKPITAHWGVPDPAAAEGSETDRYLAFVQTWRLLAHRIELFLSLPIDRIDRLTLSSRLGEIGQATNREN